MITHRFVTAPPPRPPAVRAYKWIAISFVAATVILLGVVLFVLTKKTTIMVVAKEDLKNVDITVKVAPGGGGTGTLTGNVKTVPFSWSHTYHPTGTKTVEGTAKGQVILYNKTAATQPLIKNTRLLSKEGVLFRLKDRVVVPANGQATADVFADQSGASGDIQPTSFTIPGLSEDKQAVIFAESKGVMAGGSEKVGVLSNMDISQAKEQFKQQAADAYAATASGTVPTGSKQIVSADTVVIMANHAEGDEVSEFSLTGSTTLVVVTYSSADLNALLQNAVAGKIDVTSEKVLSLENEPRVGLASYDSKTNNAELSVKQTVAVTLDASASALAPRNFTGKKKDEIERQVLSLDHVYTVDINFSPAWVSRAPDVPERINVIVKSIK
jgi:hypothetical protein